MQLTLALLTALLPAVAFSQFDGSGDFQNGFDDFTLTGLNADQSSAVSSFEASVTGDTEAQSKLYNSLTGVTAIPTGTLDEIQLSSGLQAAVTGGKAADIKFPKDYPAPITSYINSLYKEEASILSKYASKTGNYAPAMTGRLAAAGAVAAGVVGIAVLLDDFPPISPSPHPPPHLQIYTWPTCTLRELSHLLVSALPSLLPSPAIGTRLCYRLVYPDTRAPPSAPARYIAKDLGSVIVGAAEAEGGGGGGGGASQLPSEEEKDILGRDGPGGVMKGELGGEPEKTLADARFVVGDFVDVCVVETGPDGGVGRAVRGGGVGGGVSGRGGGGGVGGEYYSRGRENGFRGRGGGRGGFGGGYGGSREGVPSGEWRRGERVPGPEGGRGYGYGRGRGRGY
ncbi:MAG: hypothetical protein LQ342_005037 [Letrouitia transgressa]|nr:MAG: hypothetical protein LQ342_005037 [Letrouitia transgressa]